MGEGFAATGDAHLHPQAIVGFDPQAALAPARKRIEHRGPGRKVLGQHAPLAAGAVEIEDRVENHSPGVLDGASSGFRLGNEWLEDVPFVVCEVAIIRLRWVHPKLDV